MAQQARRGERQISSVFVGIVVIMAVTGWAVWTSYATSTGLAVFLFVTAAWVVSLCLHEYAHARTALHSGDLSVADRGYLTLNPLKYTHALLSIILPVLFVILGGLGLPGGAVYIERGAIRRRWQHSLISAAGPLTNVLFALVCTAPFWLGGIEDVPVPFRFALGFLALLQVSAAILNFLPVPGLDGYGVIEPWLSYNVRREVAPLAPIGLLLVFGLLWIPAVNQAFFGLVHAILGGLGVSELESYCGRELYTFWQDSGGFCAAPLD
ncbi:site-2 protease family protein [Streptomyces bambusae]|uniref:Site-2 protease family protein n=1 Tax=Streptomyces bambusae TaxID=1550616 RepID=A0ABS6Z713_9ACTN|nr:site-2 protease family protein [Streptomyces bambusae]MBW5483532.1 site-2 protease family protein [Streptomyces bambusae]